MIRILISMVVMGLGLSLAGCQNAQMARENDALNSPDESQTATEATGSQGDMGSLGNQDGAGGGTASEDRR